jgi:hypothetical protein
VYYCAATALGASGAGEQRKCTADGKAPRSYCAAAISWLSCCAAGDMVLLPRLRCCRHLSIAHSVRAQRYTGSVQRSPASSGSSSLLLLLLHAEVLTLLLLLQAGLTVAASTAPNQLSQWCNTEVLRDASGADAASVQPWARCGFA